MLRTWAWFTCGGLFTALYSNAVRRYPLMRIGFYLGYLAHTYEENSEERERRLMEKHRHVPVHDNWTRSGRNTEASD